MNAQPLTQLPDRQAQQGGPLLALSVVMAAGSGSKKGWLSRCRKPVLHSRGPQPGRHRPLGSSFCRIRAGGAPPGVQALSPWRKPSRREGKETHWAAGEMSPGGGLSASGQHILFLFVFAFKIPRVYKHF